MVAKPLRALVAILTISILGIGVKGVFNWAHKETTENFGMIREEIQDIAELAVLQYNYTQVVERTITGGFFSREDESLYTYDGEIKLGIKNCDEILVNISEEDKQIQIILPEIEIIAHNIDLDSYRYYLNGNDISREERTQEEAKDKAYAEEKMENATNCKERARENVEELIQKYVDLLTDKQYTIEFLTEE